MNELLTQISQDGGFLWPCGQCQGCRHRKECPYVFDQVIRHTARQGQADARRLTGEADRFLETISHANDLAGLLDGSAEIEQTLSQALSAEMALLNSLNSQTAKQCP